MCHGLEEKGRKHQTLDEHTEQSYLQMKTDQTVTKTVPGLWQGIPDPIGILRTHRRYQIECYSTESLEVFENGFRLKALFGCKIKYRF